MSMINIIPFARPSRATNIHISQPMTNDQVVNSDGGFTWQITDTDRLQRFLVIGSETSYYASADDITKGNHDCIKRMLTGEHAIKVVDVIVDVSSNGRAYKNDPALFALALCASCDKPEIRKAALDALPKVARIGTHLYHFVNYCMALRGSGRGFRNAIGRWFTSKTPDQLAFQMVKYQQRDGWSGRDLLRLAHPKTKCDELDAVFRWVIGGIDAMGERMVKRKSQPNDTWTHGPLGQLLPKLIIAFEEAKTADEKKLVKLITDHNLPREAVPTNKLNSIAVWEALLQNMPMTAMIRNLGKMTSVGLVKPLSEAAKLIRAKLADETVLKKSRIHPMQILIATKIYAQGHGDKGSLSWTPVPAILTALNEAFYKTFSNVIPCGKPLLIALDVSASMMGSAAGTALTASEAVAAFSLVHANIEPECHIFGFGDTFRELGLRKGMTLGEAISITQGLTFGRTDCSLAVQYAIDNRLKVGGFLVMTDNEVNSGRHPAFALKEYRQRFVQDARLVVLATTSTPFSIADPNDKWSLDIAGFDPTVPALIADFVRGNATEKTTEE